MLNYDQSVAFQDLKTVLGNGLLSGSTVNLISTDPLAGLKTDMADLKSDVAELNSSLASAQTVLDTAIKAGDRLSQAEVDALVRDRRIVQESHHCPHGRPTSLTLSRQELDRQFRRT